MSISIRPETPADVAPIHDLTDAAFANSTAHEALIVSSLRAASSLTLSLVAVDLSSSRIIGHVAFSPISITPATTKTWLGLGPISVAPDRQRQGVGRRLIEEGLARIKEMEDVQGCVLLGSPEFYGRFGFEAGRGLVLKGVEEKYFMSLLLDGGECPQGEVKFHEAFDQSLQDANDKAH